MCDGCPDMTVWDNRLAWSCRLEECLNFGGFIQTAHKEQPAPALAHAAAGAPEAGASR